MWEKNLESQVKEAVESADAPDAWTESKEEASEEVKTDKEVKETEVEAKVEDAKEVDKTEDVEDVEKDQTKDNTDQIKNLNTALQKEREEKREMRERIEKLSESSEVVEKMKSVFSPDEEIEEETPEYMTKDDVEKFVSESKEKDAQTIKDEAKRAEIAKEVEVLTDDFDGKDGKPLYDDSEVLKWQDNNDKFYLSPSQAFHEMKRQEIIDYEVWKRIKSQPDAIETEKPWGSQWDHNPEEKTPKEDSDILAAVTEAISSWDAEL